MQKRLMLLVNILDQVTPGASRSLGWESLIAALSFPASILLNRVLGAEDRGLLASTVVIPLTVFGLGSCQWDRLLSGLITSKQISSHEAWRRTLHYTFVLSTLFIPIGIISSFLYLKIPLESRSLSALYSISFPIHFLGLSLSSIYIASGHIDGRYVMRISLSISYLALLYGLFAFNLISIASIVIVYIAIHLISLLVGLRKAKTLLNDTLSKKKVPLSLLFRGFFPYLLENLSRRLDIWAFSIFSTLAALGQYSGITAMMLPVGLVSHALVSSSTARLDWTQPILIQRYLFKVAIVLSLLLFGLVLTGLLLGPYLLNLLLGKSFSEGAWMIPWVATVVVTDAASWQFHSALQLSGLENPYLIVQTIEPMIRLIAVMAMGWWFSEIGILLGMTATSVLKVIICLWFQQQKKFA